MPSQTVIDEVMKFLFTVQVLNKQYHLNTTSFARHKGSDNFDDLLLGHIDRFAEVFIGRYGFKPRVTSLRLSEEYLSDEGAVKLLKQTKSYLENMNSLIPDSELLNIRDEMLADVNKTLYLYGLQ